MTKKSSKATWKKTKLGSENRGLIARKLKKSVHRPNPCILLRCASVKILGTGDGTNLEEGK